MNPLAAAALILGGLYFYNQRKKKKSKDSLPGSTDPRIVYNSECSWIIPDAWWQYVAEPRFRTAIQTALAGATTWDQQLAALGKINSHQLAHSIIVDQGDASCVIPSWDVDYKNPPLGSDVRTANMYALYGHMIQKVQESLQKFAASKGTIIQLPVPMGGA